MKRKIGTAIGIVFIVLLGLAGVKALQIHKLMAFAASYTPPPETISSAVAH